MAFMAMGGLGMGSDLASTVNFFGSMMPFCTAFSQELKEAAAASTRPSFKAAMELVWLGLLKVAGLLVIGTASWALSLYLREGVHRVLHEMRDTELGEIVTPVYEAVSRSTTVDAVVAAEHALEKLR